MPIGRDGAVRRQLRTLFDAGTVVGLTDGQLLERFATRTHEAAEAAFAALVQRHGPMVLRVCRGVLDDPHDAEDAFQATFLVLVRKARGLWVRDSLGPWLHQVAYRTACRARSDVARRRRHERHAAERIAACGDEDGVDPVKEWERVLHEEIARLPERYRRAVVLCDLEGCPHEQAARHLGCPVGTVKSRLVRGRERLRGRLTRRGSAPAIGTVFSAEVAWAEVPTALRDSLIRVALRWAAPGASTAVTSASVLTLTEGAIKAMLLTKLRMAALTLLALGALITGVRQWASPASGAPPRGGPAADAPPRGGAGRIYLAAERGVTTLPNYSIIALDPETGEETRVLDGCWIRPRVSPDGRTVAFWREDALWSRSVAGGDEPKRILDVGDAGGSPPVWSPDGRQIVVSLRKGERRPPWVFTTVRVNVDGTGRTELKVPPEDGVLDWSADGQWLLTASSREAKIGWQLYVMRPDGSGRRRLTEGGNPYYARFSPEGRRVLYTDNAAGGEGDGIWVMDLDGKDRRRVFASGRSDASASWSPDGERIAVVLSPRKTGQGVQQGSRVEIIPLDGEGRATFQLPDGASLDMPDWR